MTKKKKNTDQESKKETLNEETLEKETSENGQETDLKEELKEEEKLESELNEYKDKYLRLYSEFENFRRRTNKEKMDIINNANERLIVDLLPIVDDFERAEKSFKEACDVKAIKEGVDLIYHKMVKMLEVNGVKKIESKGEKFDDDKHEAVTQIPAPEMKLKGKVVDVIEEGYKLKEKVIRYAKVVVGQ